jgi:hypothetical protein
MRSAALSLATATTYLLDRQDVDGAWREWMLEPGTSDSWTTAFVALVLTRAHRRMLADVAARLDAAIKRAVAFLLTTARLDEHGLPHWGYNGRVPTDADSTAHVALLLQAHAHIAAPAAAQALVAYHRPDGGIATFRRSQESDEWGHSHTDVTAVAIRALHHTNVATDVVAHAIRFLQQSVRADGSWPSYWWTTDHFATVAALRAFRDVGLSALAALDAGSWSAAVAEAPPFDDALRLALATLTGQKASAKALHARLLSTQHPDGSWASVPRLRVTDPYAPANVITTRTQIAADNRRVYTTAHVLHALVQSLPVIERR